MTKVVLTTKVEPVYDDLPEQRYHFPRTYLNQLTSAVGDWAVYYEPRRASGDLSSSGGRQSYFAVAKVERIYPDEKQPDHFYAEMSNYLEFTDAVPFRIGAQYFESMLQKEDGSTNKGAFGRAVRNIPDSEFDLIWASGFSHVIGKTPRTRNDLEIPEDPQPALTGLSEQGSDFDHAPPDERDRRIIAQLVNRPFRDRAFAAAVKTAYRDTCAMSGLKFINGGGRSEVQAAHIKPVEKSGPDSVRNGIALSGTMHWLFDRGLVSIDDDFRLLVARDRAPDSIGRLLEGRTHLWTPTDQTLRPHSKFLRYHRDSIFKG
jgi:putative restriction endonuclease